MITGIRRLMPVITSRPTGHNARRWSGIIGAGGNKWFKGIFVSKKPFVRFPRLARALLAPAVVPAESLDVSLSITPYGSLAVLCPPQSLPTPVHPRAAVNEAEWILLESEESKRPLKQRNRLSSRESLGREPRVLYEASDEAEAAGSRLSACGMKQSSLGGAVFCAWRS